MRLAAGNPKADLPNRVLTYLERCEAADPREPRWKRRQYQLLVALERPADLARKLRQWIDAGDSATAWRLTLGRLLAEEGRLADAIHLFEAVRSAEGPPRRRLSPAGRLVCGHQPAQGRGAGCRRGRRGGGRTRPDGSAAKQAPGVAAGCRGRRHAPRPGRGSAARPAGGPEEVPRSPGGPGPARASSIKRRTTSACWPGWPTRCSAARRWKSILSSKAPDPCSRQWRTKPRSIRSSSGSRRSAAAHGPRSTGGPWICSKRSSTAAPRTWPTSPRRTPRGQWRPCEGPGRTPGPPASRRGCAPCWPRSARSTTGPWPSSNSPKWNASIATSPVARPSGPQSPKAWAKPIGPTSTTTRPSKCWRRR